MASVRPVTALSKKPYRGRFGVRVVEVHFMMQSNDKQFVSKYLAEFLAVMTTFATDQAVGHTMGRWRKG
jgi:hypothetical protein